jgi:hypothetical protein
MKPISLLILISIAFAKGTEAQSFYTLRKNRTLIATAALNSSTYYGDLKDDSDLIDVRPGLSLGVMKALNGTVSVRSEFSWLHLQGRDLPTSGSGRAGRNLSFYSSNYELNVAAVVNIIPHHGRFYQRPNMNVYGFLGIGGLYFNPKTRLDGKEYELQPLQTEGVKYSRVTFVIPMGIGGKMKLTPFVNLALEMGWRKTFTDYLDDVSTVHIDPATVSNPITRKLIDRRPEVNLLPMPPGTKRGNAREKDGYMLLSFKFEYYLPVYLGQNRELYRRQRVKYR